MAMESAFSFTIREGYRTILMNSTIKKCELESDCILDAKEHLLKAYMAEGSTIFEGENLKYLQAIKRLIRH